MMMMMMMDGGGGSEWRCATTWDVAGYLIR